MLNKPKILVIDIETKPAKGYFWGLWDQNIGLNQIEDEGGILCFAAKYVGEPEVFFYSDWEHGQAEMIRQAHRLLSECDAVVTYNGDKFDIPSLMVQFLAQGLKMPPPLTSIDLYKFVKSKLKLLSNKLAFVGTYFKIGAKIKNEGFGLWLKVMAGDPRAQQRMQRYCIGDIKLTEKAYKKFRPFMLNHPHLGDIGSTACGACGSKHVQSRGYRRTKSFRIQRIQCQTCGSWQDGKRQKVT